MIQWLLRKTINGMGRVYVILDSFLKNEGGPILGIEIDDDFENMSRNNCVVILNISLVGKTMSFGLYIQQIKLESVVK